MKTNFNPLTIIGKTEKDAIKLLKSNEVKKVRVVERDGEVFETDSGYVKNRFNLYIENGLVYRFSKG